MLTAERFPTKISNGFLIFDKYVNVGEHILKQTLP